METCVPFANKPVPVGLFRVRYKADVVLFFFSVSAMLLSYMCYMAWLIWCLLS